MKKYQLSLVYWAVLLWLLMPVILSRAADEAQKPSSPPPSFQPKPASPAATEGTRFVAVSGELFRAKKHDPVWFRENLKEASWSAEIRQLFLIHLGPYYERVGKPPDVLELINAWRKEAPPLVASTNARPPGLGFPRPPGFPGMMGGPAIRQRPEVPPVPTAKGKIPLKSFMVLEPPVTAEMEFNNLSIIDAFARGDTLWLDARAIGGGGKQMALLFGINLRSQEQDVIVFEPATWQPGCVEISGQTIVLRGGDALKTYQLKTRTQRNVPVILDADARLLSYGTNLLAVSSNSIVQVDLETEKTTVLASLRRRPAQSLVDELPTLHPGLVLPKLDGSLRLLAGPTVYDYGTNKTWTKAFDLETNAVPRNARFNWLAENSAAGFAVLNDPFGAIKLYGLLPGHPEPLLVSGSTSAQWDLNGRNPPLTPSWPINGLSVDGYHIWRGQDLLSTTSARGANGAGFELNCSQFTPRRIVSLTPVLPKGVPEDDISRYSGGSNSKLIRIPGGWAAVAIGRSSYWTIAESDLNRALVEAR